MELSMGVLCTYTNYTMTVGVMGLQQERVEI